MHAPIIQIEWNGRRIHSFTPDGILSVQSSNGAPKGRKGPLMAERWQALRAMDYPGVIWMDPDIAIDPLDAENMADSIDLEPDSVHVAPHRLWPASTGRQEWVWGHGLWGDNAPVMTQIISTPVEWFAMGFTYTPRRLLNIAFSHLPFWEYGMVDMGLSRLAREYDIPARLVLDCRPKHLHFIPGDDYMEWVKPW